MKQLFTLIIISLLPSILIGQTNFQKGYIVQFSGDTLRGEIDNRDWSKSPEFVRFRKNKTTEVQKLNAYQCQGFGVNDGLGYSSIRTTLYQTKEKGSEAKFDMVKDTTVFMEILCRGKLTLLEFTEMGEKSRFFIQTSKIKTEQLIYHSYFEDVHLYHNRKYQNQLAILTNKNTQNLPYERNYLIKFINNDSKPPGAAKEEKKVNLQACLGATFYDNFSIVRHNNGEEIANFGSNIQPTIGLNVNFPVSKELNTFSFDFSVLFSPYSGKKIEGDSYMSLKKIHASNLFFSLAAKYAFFTKGELKPYIGIGAGLNEPIGDYLIRTDGKKVKLPVRPQSDDFEFNVHPARLFALLGLQINSKLSSELRFDRIPKYNLRIDTKAPLNSLSLIFYWKIR